MDVLGEALTGLALEQCKAVGETKSAASGQPQQPTLGGSACSRSSLLKLLTAQAVAGGVWGCEGAVTVMMQVVLHLQASLNRCTLRLTVVMNC